MFLALNEIIKEKSRFILITAVIMLVSYLVFFLTGLAYGLATSYTRVFDSWGASGIILNANANDNIGRSLIFESDYQGLLSDDVAPLGAGVATVDSDPVEDVSLFGVARDSFLLPAVTDGRDPESVGEVVVDATLVDYTGGLGGQFRLQGSEKQYTVVGVVNDAIFQTSPVIFMSLSDWRIAASETAGMTAMRDDSIISALVTRGEMKSVYSTKNLKWQTLKDFTFTLPGYKPQVLTFSLMIGFLIAIAAFVLAIFVYILTLQKKSVFGVLKAEGIPGRYIGWSVMAQVLIISVTGLLLGMGFALLTGLGLAGKVPFALNPLFFIAITGLFIICAVFGGVASVRSVSKIDPVEAID